jgi:hypothetical protein
VQMIRKATSFVSDCDFRGKLALKPVTLLFKLLARTKSVSVKTCLFENNFYILNSAQYHMDRAILYILVYLKNHRSLFHVEGVCCQVNFERCQRKLGFVFRI